MSNEVELRRRHVLRQKSYETRLKEGGMRRLQIWVTDEEAEALRRRLQELRSAQA